MTSDGSRPERATDFLLDSFDIPADNVSKFDNTIGRSFSADKTWSSIEYRRPAVEATRTDRCWPMLMNSCRT